MLSGLLIVFDIIVCIALVGIVLIQKSEGGAFGSGGPTGLVTARGAGDLLTRTTWILFALFLLLSIGLTILGVHDRANSAFSQSLKGASVSTNALNAPVNEVAPLTAPTAPLTAPGGPVTSPSLFGPTGQPPLTAPQATPIAPTTQGPTATPAPAKPVAKPHPAAHAATPTETQPTTAATPPVLTPPPAATPKPAAPATPAPATSSSGGGGTSGGTSP